MNWYQPNSRLSILGLDGKQLMTYDLNPLETQIVTHHIAVMRQELDSNGTYRLSDAESNMIRLVTEMGYVSFEGLSRLSKIPIKTLHAVANGDHRKLPLEQFERIWFILHLLDLPTPQEIE